MNTSVEMTPEQLRAHAAKLMEQAKQAERESAEREREAKAAKEREEADRVARERVTKRQEFSRSLVKQLNDVLIARGVTLSYDHEAAWSKFKFKTHPRAPGDDFPVIEDRICMEVESAVETRGHRYSYKQRYTGRHDIIVGDYGSRKRFKERADGTLNVDRIADSVYDQALRAVHRHKSENATKKADAIVEALKKHFNFGKYDTTVSVTQPASATSPVTFGKDGIRVAYDGSVEKTERLLAMAEELKNLIKG